jgi:gliding motility-associated-like protein
MIYLKKINTLKKMKKKYFLLLLVFPIFSFSGLSQTFSNSSVSAYDTWNTSNSWATALTKTITVSGLSTPLTSSSNVLKQINLTFGDGTHSTLSLSSFSIRLKSPAGTTINVVTAGSITATSITNFNAKYRDDNILTFPSASTQEPFDIGYYRTTNANAFSAVNGEDPNGSWVLEIIEATSFEIAFVSVDLVFGPAIVVNDITSTTINDSCASPQCMGESSVVKATISSYTGNANDPNTISPYPGGCNWNGAHNNSAWFVFQPSGTTAKLTISGVQNFIQTLIVNETDACVSGSQTVPAGGCPIDGVNDTYTSPRYIPSTGSSSNEQFNLSGLIPGNNYFLVIDGNGGAISPLYIELSGGLVELCCPTVISGSTDVCAGSASSVYTQVGGASGGTWSVSPASAGTIDPTSGSFTPSNILSTISATISYDDGSCVKTFSITVHAVSIAALPSSSPTVCVNTLMSSITIATTGATGIDLVLATGIPAGVTASFTGNATSGTITLIGTPTTAVGSPFSYSIPLTGGCGTVSATGAITVTPINTAAGPSSSPTVCENTLMSSITIATTGATGISNDGVSGANGLPAGVSATWSANTITISGTPTTAVGSPFSYSIPLTGGCGTVSATGTITVSIVPMLLATVTSQPTCSVSTGSITASSAAAASFELTGLVPVVAMTSNVTGVFTTLNPGTYEVIAVANGCSSAAFPFTINTQPSTPSAPVGSFKQYFCSTSAKTIGDINVTGTNIKWYDATTSGTLLNPSDLLIDGTHYYATQTVAGCESALSLDVLVYLDSIQLDLTSQTSSACGQQTGSAVVLATNGIGLYSYLWSNSDVGNINTNLGSGEYSVVVTDALGCTDLLLVSINCEGVIPEIITPNGDGKNETWILNLDPKVSVQLYNRWGNLIYSALPYLDDWEGKANEGITVGNDYLPNGTYFFLIDYQDGNKPKSGYIELIR